MTSARSAGGLPIGLIEECTPLPGSEFCGVRRGDRGRQAFRGGRCAGCAGSPDPRVERHAFFVRELNDARLERYRRCSDADREQR
jgi:hypothetical protein